MAPVLEYLAAAPPSASALPPISATAICSLSGARVSMKLPEFRGLKAKSSVSSGGAVRSVKSNVRIVRRGGVVVCESQETAVEVPPLTEAAWQSKVLDSDTPVLVEFWAQWCGPCRMIHPHVEELAKQYTGKLKCFKVNTDECPEIASRYGIRSIPTVMIFKNGEKKDAIIGAVPKSTLATNIEKFL